MDWETQDSGIEWRSLKAICASDSRI